MTKCTAQRCGDVDMSDKMCFTFFFFSFLVGGGGGLHTVLGSWRIPTFTFKIKNTLKYSGFQKTYALLINGVMLAMPWGLHWSH